MSLRSAVEVVLNEKHRIGSFLRPLMWSLWIGGFPSLSRIANIKKPILFISTDNVR